MSKRHVSRTEKDTLNQERLRAAALRLFRLMRPEGTTMVTFRDEGQPAQGFVLVVVGPEAEQFHERVTAISREIVATALIARNPEVAKAAAAAALVPTECSHDPRLTPGAAPYACPVCQDPVVPGLAHPARLTTGLEATEPGALAAIAVARG